MSIVNEPATPESCQQDYRNRTAADPNPVKRAAVQNPGRITSDLGIHRQRGNAAK